MSHFKLVFLITVLMFTISCKFDSQSKSISPNSSTPLDDNTPLKNPIANAGIDFSISDNDGNGTESAKVDASSSSSSEGQIVNYTWKEGTNILKNTTSPTTEFNLNIGTHVIELTVTDINNLIATDELIIIVSEKSPLPDTTAPIISISSPTNNSTVKETISITANANDNVGVIGVLFKINTQNIGNEDNTEPYSRNFDTKTLANGSYTIEAIARDAAGNTKTSSIDVMINNPVENPLDTIAPTISISSPTNNSTVNETISITANANDNVGVVGVLFKINNQNIGNEDSTEPYSRNFDTKTLANGSYTIEAIARDAAGNTKTNSIDVMINNPVENPLDTIAPTISISSPTNNSTVNETISITANANDNVGVVGVLFKINNQNIGNEDNTEPYSRNFDTKTLANGSYTIEAIARDAAGNTKITTVSITVNNSSIGSPLVSDDFNGTGSLLGYTTTNPNVLPNVGRLNNRYNAILTDNAGNKTLHFHRAQGRLDAKLVSFPFEYIARNIGIGTIANSQVAPDRSGYMFSGIQVHSTNLSAADSAHIVVGHRGSARFTIEGKNTVNGRSTVNDIGRNKAPLGRADIRVVGNSDRSLTIYWQNPNFGTSSNDNWQLYKGTGNLPGSTAPFGSSVYIGLITYAYNTGSVPFVGTCDSIELVGE